MGPNSLTISIPILRRYGQTCQPLIKENLETLEKKNQDNILQKLVRFYFSRSRLNKPSFHWRSLLLIYLTIIPRAWMCSKSIAHEAEGRMSYWLRGHEGERNNCFSKIQLVGQKYRDKTTLASKTRFSRHCFGFQSWRFSLLVGYNI